MKHQWQIMEGTPGIGPQEVAHLLIPGRGRTVDGFGLPAIGEHRVRTAAAFYVTQGLATQGGVIVCSGYKSPADRGAQLWKSTLDGKEYEGMPEAYIAADRLVDSYGLRRTQIVVEPDSIDTVTNFTRSQRKFPDDRPVGIVSQEQHLDRILRVIAPKTMRREYVGIVVPELEGMPDVDTWAARMVSRYVVFGLTPESPRATIIAQKRVERVWRPILSAVSLLRAKGDPPHLKTYPQA